MFQQLPNILATSLLTAVFILVPLRWIFGKLAKPLSGFAKLGAKIAGEKSGFLGASNAVKNSVASGILNSPQISGLKMIAKQFGFDLDEMIADHGEAETLAGLTQILQMVGIDPAQLLSQGLGSLGKDFLGSSNNSKPVLSSFGGST